MKTSELLLKVRDICLIYNNEHSDADFDHISAIDRAIEHFKEVEMTKEEKIHETCKQIYKNLYTRSEENDG